MVCLARCVFKHLYSINEKGFVSHDVLENTFMRQIMSHLASLGYKRKILGNSIITYTMWYNLIFLNVYYLIEKCLKDHLMVLLRTSSS